jgi:4-hydroxythreonine-4-phosphate dehydrogenase
VANKYGGKMKIAITVGDPAGIGPEIVLKMLEHATQYNSLRKHHYLVAAELPTFALTCSNSKNRLQSISQELNINLVAPSAPLPKEAGQPSAAGGLYSVAALRLVWQWIQKKKARVIATAPIDKKSLQIAQISEVDHTAIFKKLSGVSFVDTLFKTRNLFIYFYSKHIPFDKISQALNPEHLYQTILRCLKYNQRLGIDKNNKPMALAALNPHASDSGRFGNEEATILQPVVQRLQIEGYPVAGPIPADSVFALASQGVFSSVLSLYHDQGHIAAKTMDFYRTVSLSPGMPILRTSVDHGTAMEIAGKNQASAVSMIHAVKTAIQFGSRYHRSYTLNV